MSLLAVHISDGVLSPAWQFGGWVLTSALAAYGSRRLGDEEIPRVALLTAALFVASLVHVRVGSVTSVHLLLNGLVGVILGRRAAIAIPVAVALQAALFQHGGFLAFGANSCVLTIPALLAGWCFSYLRQSQWMHLFSVRAMVVGLSVFLLVLCVAFSLSLLAQNYSQRMSDIRYQDALAVVYHPLAIGLAVVLGLAAVVVVIRLDPAPEFALGLLTGEVTVLLTSALNAAVLIWGGQEDWPTLALIGVLAHTVIAVVEGVVLGFTVAFLARVKPELLLSS